MNHHHDHSPSSIPLQCRCCTKSVCNLQPSDCVSRRGFMQGASAIAAGGIALSALGAQRAFSDDTEHIKPIQKTLTVQPVFLYYVAQPREKTSWRGWGGIKTQQDVAEERRRIEHEMESLKKEVDFPIEIRPLREAQSPGQAAAITKEDYDVTLMFASNCGTDTVEALSDPNKWTLMFVRHRSGPVYLWYEIAHNRYLRKTVDDFGQPGVGPTDVIVDRMDEVAWRLKSLYAVKNTLGKKIVSLGGPSGWGAGGQKAPDKTREIFKMELIDVTYDDLSVRIKTAQANKMLVKRCAQDSANYLKQPGVELNTDPEFMERAFLLTEVFKQLMDEAGTDSFTINNCMGTVMGISETTACMPLSLLNDGGYLAFCESDYVVIPSGVLLHYLCNKPVFLNDPTYPHDGVVTMAHCTAPRKMDGETDEPVNILTHFESDYGAAPKVEFKLGETMTVIDPDFNFERWMGFTAEVVDNPFLDICRSQVDIEMHADTDRVNEETRGFHWMACYGDYTKETGYALDKIGIDWLKLT